MDGMADGGFIEPNTTDGAPILIVKDITISPVVMLLQSTHWFGGVDSG